MYALSPADHFSPMHSTIRVFNDRIEFQYPGSFAVRISDKPDKVKSVPLNPNIIALFRYARQGDNAGYGIDKIIRWTELTGLEVDFESDITSSTVTFPLPLLKSGQISLRGSIITFRTPMRLLPMRGDAGENTAKLRNAA